MLFKAYIDHLERSSDNEILNVVIRHGESWLNSILNVCCQGAVLHCNDDHEVHGVGKVVM